MESITLDPSPTSAASARWFIGSGWLSVTSNRLWLSLLTSELVANVIHHAQTQLTLVVKLDRCVRVEVHDGLAATDAFREILASPPLVVPPESPSGRGLGLVHALASRFGLADEPGEWNGKIVWFELDHADLAIRGRNFPTRV